MFMGYFSVLKGTLYFYINFVFLTPFYNTYLIFLFRYMVSLEQFIWKDLQKTVSMTKLLKCEARVRQEAVEPFYIKVTK